MTTGHYRDATADDIDHIVKLVEFCYRSEESAQAWTSEYYLVKGRRSSKAEISRSVTGPDSMMIVGEVKGVLASCCRLTVAPRKRVHLGLFCVRPELQSKGLGSELLEAVTRTSRARFNADVLSLQVLSKRGELRAWYERIGFQETGEHFAFSKEGDPALALVGDLEFVVYERALKRASPPI